MSNQENKKKLYVVSNAHLDTQWNWTVKDTIRDCIKNTMEQNFALFEKYPHYKMNFEGAFRYKLMKEYYPKMYEKVKEFIAEGRWNVSGSQWDASDANVPSSEAYMRQILLGNGYFEKEFGKKSSDIFLTDCFGFRWSLPSIAAHMGLNGFSTQKLVWGVGSPIYREDGSVTKPMPEKDVPRMDLGKWVGPDGNYVIASMLGGNYTLHFEWDKEGRPIHEREEYLKQIEHNEKWTGVPARMMYYGVGDYGGSPSDESVRYVNEAIEQNGEDKAFEVIAASTDQIMNELTEEEIANLPAYEGGLLIPHGYGALTSHTINKRWNRKCELLADSAERLAVLAELTTGTPYPKAKLDEAWKAFLWHQFHDDLPGTSIMDAYRFTHNDFVMTQNILAQEVTASAEAVASAMHTDVAGTPVMVYNPVSATRQDAVTVELPITTPYVQVFAPCGKELPAQVEVRDGKTYVIFVPKMKPVSTAIFDIRESTEPSATASALQIGQRSLENESYRVTLTASGDIASVYDLQNGRELLSAPATLEVREDTNTVWPSWEIAYKDIEKPTATVSDLVSMEIYENGPAAVSFKVVKKYEDSTFTQIIRLTAGGKWVEVENDVDWLCRKSMLMAQFPLSVSNPVAEFDLGLGADRGENTNSFPYFQHCVHQWADLTDTDGSYGVSILNDCKYGMEKPADNTLRLSLIHTPTGNFMPISAEDWQDFGKNLFRYGITGHTGARDSVGSLAAAFNQPLMAFAVSKHTGRSGRQTLAAVDNDAVVIRAIKKEEKGDRIILRVQETAGKSHDKVTVTLPADILTAVETNGYEDEIAEATFAGAELTLAIGKYQPKTFALTLADLQCGEAVTNSPLDLPYNTKITTTDDSLTDGEVSEGISIPAELFESQMSCGSQTFRLGTPAADNALRAAGQTISLPKGYNKLAILATSAGEDLTVELNGQTVTVRNYLRPVGTWDLIGKGDGCMTVTDQIGIVYTHTHNAEGNCLYDFAYVYRYDIDITGAESLTLPENSDLLILAATAYTGGDTKAVTPLCDSFPENTAALHNVTVYNGGEQPEIYHLPAGRRMMLSAGELGSTGLFDHWEGDGKIVYRDGGTVILEMGDTDVTLNAVYSSIGENVVLNKPAKASHCTDEEEGPDKAVNGSDEDKWCGTVASKDGYPLWLEVDIGDPTFIDKWVVRHCGAYEDKDWNTFDFGLQYRTYENEEWKMADAVIGNRDDLTFRTFTPVMARFVRLYITVPAVPSKDDEQSLYARIYQFQVYKANND